MKSALEFTTDGRELFRINDELNRKERRLFNVPLTVVAESIRVVNTGVLRCPKKEEWFLLKEGETYFGYRADEDYDFAAIIAKLVMVEKEIRYKIVLEKS